MADSLEQQVIALIARHKGLDPRGIAGTSELSALGVSSLDAITIVYDLEEALGVEVPNEDLASLRTVQDIVEGLRRLLGGAGPA